MLLVISALKGYALESTDGLVGTVTDFLFDQRSWFLKWAVVETGTWLNGRKVLIHPSAFGEPDYDRELIPVRLTKHRIEESPAFAVDRPVFPRDEVSFHNFYGIDPLVSTAGFFGVPSDASRLDPTAQADRLARRAIGDAASLEEDDASLRGVTDIVGFHMRAIDETIGHLENLLIDDETWSIRYLIVGTKTWWPGAHVLISPYAVRAIDWADREVALNITRQQVKTSPPWDPIALMSQMEEKHLHRHYGWPGYGW